MVAEKTGLNQLKDRNRTVVDQLPPVQSGLSQKKGQFGLVVVHSCPFLEAKTGLNQTFRHHSLDKKHQEIQNRTAATISEEKDEEDHLNSTQNP